MRRAGKTFSCPWLLIHQLLHHWEETHASVINYFIDGKRGMENFNS